MIKLLATALPTLVALGCAAPDYVVPPPGPPSQARFSTSSQPPAPSAPQSRCDAPHAIVKAVKLHGDPADLVDEAAAAGISGSVRVSCLISTRGETELCQMVTSVPEGQQRAVFAKLKTWRFTPALFDGRVAALEHTLDVPLTTKPVPSPPIPVDPRTTLKPGEMGMNRPVLISGSQAPSYTQLAREMCMEGKVIAKCIITEDGSLADCHIIRSVPYLDEAVLQTLAGQRYTPIMFRGAPQRVSYVIPFNFKLK